jgi:hypothetical protein
MTRLILWAEREKKGRLLHQLQMLNSPALEMYHEKDGKSELPPPARDHGALLSKVCPPERLRREMTTCL